MKRYYNKFLDFIRTKKRPGKEEYILSRKKAFTAPYPVTLYSEFLLMIKKDPGNAISPFINETPNDKRSARFFIRHDIDTAACIRKMGLLLAVNRRLDLPAALFFRADDVEYHLPDFKDDITRYKNQGFEIGLHTVCYTVDDFLAEFRREIKVFTESLGFAPRTFTVHGLGPHFRMEQRMKFCAVVAENLGEYGFFMTDCSSQLREYDYVFQDCHMTGIHDPKIIFNDFMSLPPFIQKGKNYLILTHPTYWQEINKTS